MLSVVVVVVVVVDVVFLFLLLLCFVVVLVVFVIGVAGVVVVVAVADDVVVVTALLALLPLRMLVLLFLHCFSSFCSVQTNLDCIVLLLAVFIPIFRVGPTPVAPTHGLIHLDCARNATETKPNITCTATTTIRNNHCFVFCFLYFVYFRCIWVV